MRLRPQLGPLLLTIACVPLFTGCGGMVLSPAVSPLTFLLPGFVEADQPKLPAEESTTETIQEGLPLASIQ